MRRRLTTETLAALMRELGRRAPARGRFRVYFVGGATAVDAGFRESTIDADLYSDTEAVFREIQTVKERLGLNIEFARPEDFVPPLEGSDGRHVFIRTVDRVTFYHYDPYAQLLSKVVRGFTRDLDDARMFVQSGMVEPGRFRRLVEEIPTAAYAKYPAITPEAVLEAVHGFLASVASSQR
ncbi:MAG: hypothetical protein AB7I50_02630 [Vicinamibacterales bacterium]